MYVVITGGLGSGIEAVFGPFNSEELAEEFAETLEDIGTGDYFIWEITKPENGETR